MKENPKAIQDFKAGEQKAISFLIGEVMKKSNRRADFKSVREIILKMIK